METSEGYTCLFVVSCVLVIRNTVLLTKRFVAKYITGRRSFNSGYIARFAGDILGNKSSKNLFLT